MFGTLEGDHARYYITTTHAVLACGVIGRVADKSGMDGGRR